MMSKLPKTSGQALVEPPDNRDGKGTVMVRSRSAECISPVEAVARVLIERLFERTPGLLMACVSDPVAVVLEIPGEDWAEFMLEAWYQRLRLAISQPGGGNQEATAGQLCDVSDFDGCSQPRDASLWIDCTADGGGKERWTKKRAFVDALAEGFSAIGVSQAPERYLSAEFIRAADWRVSVPPLVPDALDEAIEISLGERPSKSLDPELCRFVGVTDLYLARRPGQKANDYVARLRTLVEGKTAKRSVTLNDLYGMDEAVAWGHDLAADLHDYAQGQLLWAAIDKGVLLVGPPGTGKTTFARALAATCGVPLIAASLYQWQSAGHLGDLQRAMRRTFEEARKAAPVILFVDELDAFGDRDSFTHDHKDYSIQVINGFLEELDGVAGREGVVLVGACNNVQRLDPAIRRSGRLDRTIQIPLPDQRALGQIFRHHLGDGLLDADLTQVAMLALGGSGADVERWTRGAKRRARTAGRSLTLDDLVTELRGTANRKPEALRRCAVHEAGHAVAMAVLAPGRLISTTIREAERTGGATASYQDNPFPTRGDLLVTVVVTLAGRAAEQIVLGEASASSGGGEQSDLARATTLATSMLTAYCLDDEAGLLWLGEATSRNIDLFLRMRPHIEQRVSAILADAYDRCRNLVREHHAVVEAVADMLLERETLSGAEVEDVLERHRLCRCSA